MKRVSKETWIQVGLTLATIAASAYVPEIRKFADLLLENFPLLLIVIFIVSIFYLQAIKMIKAKMKLLEANHQAKENQLLAKQNEWERKSEERFKKMEDKSNHQAVLIEKILQTNTLHLAITRDVVLPIIYRDNKDEVIKKMYYNTVRIPALQEHRFEGVMITEYQKFFHQKEVERFSS